ncbi:alcohol dehydrogenase [Xylaria bambusicola]|uniref:alcohol dehydrogenase n=1 Tax=Xylaria bambusicola TaxID=326684 RepID=UPI002007F50A|nr:alcohol dehydrogenase [Xylaria bambusicola]KAI0514670.1 alcohol dehydrogenase [Xylaria bambusicola]
MAPSLPSMMRAVVQTAPGTASVESVPIPKVEYGSALVKLEASLVHSNLSPIFKADLDYFKLPYPAVPGSFGIGRVAAVGPDATALREGDFVIVSAFIHSRDDPSVNIIRGVLAGPTPASQHLYKTFARNGFFAEYVTAPLETIFRLDEARLFGSPEAGGLGYIPGELVVFPANVICYAAMRGISLQPGERVVITPATGHYSAAAVDVAAALGARVIAASRNAAGLAKLKETYPGVVDTVQLTGDVKTDGAALSAFGPVDAVVDVSPPAATGAPNFAAALSSLRDGGRVTLVGGRGDETLPIPYLKAMMSSLTIKGSYMYAREDVEACIRLAEAGLLKFGKRAGHVVHAVYTLDDFQEAMDRAVETAGPGSIIYIKP